MLLPATVQEMESTVSVHPTRLASNTQLSVLSRIRCKMSNIQGQKPQSYVFSLLLGCSFFTLLNSLCSFCCNGCRGPQPFWRREYTVVPCLAWPTSNSSVSSLANGEKCRFDPAPGNCTNQRTYRTELFLTDSSSRPFSENANPR